MKTEGEINHKLKQVCFRHLKKELAECLSQDPKNCKHWTNLAMCQLGNVPCHRKPNNALVCGIFEQVNDKDVLKNEMKEFFRTRPAAEIAVRFPDVAALMWVLDGPVSAEVFLEEFREEGLRASLSKADASLSKADALLAERQIAIDSLQSENCRLKAALYDIEAMSFSEITSHLKDKESEHSTALQGYVEEVARLREPRTPWYLSLYQRIFK